MISPANTHKPVFTRVSAATRALGSCANTASRMASEIWSATLSGWPSETDSDVKRYSLMAVFLRQAVFRRPVCLVRPSEKIFFRFRRPGNGQKNTRIQAGFGLRRSVRTKPHRPFFAAVHLTLPVKTVKAGWHGNPNS